MLSQTDIEFYCAFLKKENNKGECRLWWHKIFDHPEKNVW